MSGFACRWWVVVSLTLLAGCGRGTAKVDRDVPVYATPAEVFAAATEAGAAKDIAKLYDCYSRQSQRRRASNLMQPVLVGTLAKDPSPFLDPAWKALEKHGIRRADLEEIAKDPRKDRPRPLDAVKDYHSLILDLEAVLPAPDDEQPPFRYDALKDLTIDGDIAYGIAHAKDKEDAADNVAPMYFVKQDGGWKIDLYRVEPETQSLLKGKGKK